MKIIQCDQRGYEWFKARMGKPTASGVCNILTPGGKRRTGATPRRYMLELLAERLTLEPAESYTTAAMERGIELEPRARQWYALATGREVREVGIIMSDCGRWGCSPDGLMDDAGLEIKCPLTATFMEVAESRTLPEDHMTQCQFGLWITGLSRWDYVLHTDKRGLQSQIIQVRPDEKMHAAFAEILPAFCAELDAMESKMRADGHGYTPPQDDGPTWEEITEAQTII